MKIKILKAGRYNDANHSAQDCEEGQVFETGVGYGESLIESGYADYAEGEPEPEEEAPKKKSTKKAKEAPASRTKPNPFLS